MIDVAKQVKTWQSQGLHVVLVTGVFDLLHIEHIRFLKAAKQEGDKLIVGIETDDRVKLIKGHDRPINNQQVRLEQLSALKSVDLVFLLPTQFSEQTDWERFIDDIHPSIYAVSSHTSHLSNKQSICDSRNVKLIVVHQFNPDISTSQIIKKVSASS